MRVNHKRCDVLRLFDALQINQDHSLTQLLTQCMYAHIFYLQTHIMILSLVLEAILPVDKAIQKQTS